MAAATNVTLRSESLRINEGDKPQPRPHQAPVWEGSREASSGYDGSGDVHNKATLPTMRCEAKQAGSVGRKGKRLASTGRSRLPAPREESNHNVWSTNYRTPSVLI
jgi:hypothetical protein